ncbi:MAG: sel1 repeat family protein [Nitrospira sp.]|nr:sel1 repeat family protein [Nitrospira sp.]
MSARVAQQPQHSPALTRLRNRPSLSLTERLSTNQSKGSSMNLRYLLLVSTLVGACVCPSLVLADESQEVKTYRAQCDRGELAGCVNLGWMYDNGNGVKQDSIHAVELFRKACDGGDTKGCFNLGWMYDEGNGVKLDPGHAVEFFRKACDGGHAKGCTKMGYMSEKGAGVRHSDTDALNYFAKACELKYEGGCEEYARMKKTR